jgi:hypothetical protein
MDIIDQYLGLWGVDVAVKKLRPHAQFELYNTIFTKWVDPTGTQPPTWEEINQQIEKDKELCHTLHT